ncbi:MAG: TIGR04013 family B12-binding domain/radical SAM domain-containing protein [Myxococcales bacterium]|nr:TIGR04013 family B12-binding domain/radical SAM domain-containing protein [Myxococcales bacterium]
MSVAVVIRDTKTAHHAMCVLTGALRADPRTEGVPLHFAEAGLDLDGAIDRALLAADTILCLWSFYSTELEEALSARAALRPRTERVLHVAGGVHATAEPAETLAAGFELVALGEGERTIVDLVLALAEGADPRRVTGLGWLDDHGSYRSLGPGERVVLDDWPAHNARDMRFCPIEITRGCVYACRFCQTPYVFKARFRHRSVENVRAHVRAMRAAGLPYVRFLSPTSLSYGATGTEVSLDAIEALLAGVREEAGPETKIFFGTFPSEVRPEHVTDDALRVMKRYVNNDNIVIGGQSGSERVLASSLRGHDVADVVRAVKTAAKWGFRPNVDMLFGLPGEEEEDRDATRRLMQELVDLGGRVHSHTFLPLPGTPLASAPGGTVDGAIARDLELYEARGRSYGSWRTQIVSAERLSARRKNRASGRAGRLAKGEE